MAELADAQVLGTCDLLVVQVRLLSPAPMSASIKLKRIYEDPSEDDGYRVLVDRLWPRGISKEGAKLDLWMKDIAPSTELRKWFSHDVDKWEEFQKRYKVELKNNPEVSKLRDIIRSKKITLLFAARDVEHNEAIVIKDFIGL